MLYCGCPFCRLCSNFCKRKFDFILLNSLSWYICFIVLKIILFIYLTVWDLRWGFSGGSRGKRICLPVQEMQQMRVRSLGQEEPLEWDLGNGSKDPRKWPPTPAFLPGEFHEQRCLVSYSPWGCKESDTTEDMYVRAHTHIHIHSHTQVLVAALRISITSCGIILLWHTDSLAVAWGLSYSAEGGIWVHWPGIQPVSPGLQDEFLTTGPPGKSQGLDTFLLASALCLALWGWDMN